MDFSELLHLSKTTPICSGVGFCKICPNVLGLFIRGLLSANRGGASFWDASKVGDFTSAIGGRSNDQWEAGVLRGTPGQRPVPPHTGSGLQYGFTLDGRVQFTSVRFRY